MILPDAIVKRDRNRILDSTVFPPFYEIFLAMEIFTQTTILVSTKREIVKAGFVDKEFIIFQERDVTCFYYAFVQLIVNEEILQFLLSSDVIARRQVCGLGRH